MMRDFRRSLRAAMLALAPPIIMASGGPFCAGAAAASSLPVLEPYQLVRSLRMLQDQVVSGKPEALAMLNRVLARIAQQLQAGPPDVWSKTVNLHAAVIYLLNGGNPDVVRAILAAAPPEALPPRLVAGALAYADANSAEAVQQFSDPLPPGIPNELLASIYLVTAPQVAVSDPSMAMKRLDMVRVSVPGSLFEEAAIRRSLRIAARLGDAAKVKVLARNYLQRFSRSPYAEDFFRQFVDAVLQLKDKIGNDEIAELAQLAKPAAQHTFYLRVARGALLDGQMERARFISAKAAELAAELHLDGTQARLYSAASKAGSMRARDAIRTLSEIPRERLHERDKRLLDAAEAMAGRVLREPAQPASDPPMPSKAEVVPIPASSENDPSWTRSHSEPDSVPDSALQETVDDTKKKLAEIDQLLGKATQ
ncbi:chemotaxis protein MotC [Phyllobacterium phragmitis]|uniref:Chemotaxis protein MotC n=1 Tax=Phyllobacterium phragmitis TaxID=2670329 RepID=A0A2S9IQ76_9HYPH|nr:chemotaxis protein MotC [Phyllobacterium phragmitis]PRD42665.1 chemotaxis protein MotC [Phyllobacterium phragmitis]